MCFISLTTCALYPSIKLGTLLFKQCITFNFQAIFIYQPNMFYSFPFIFYSHLCFDFFANKTQKNRANNIYFVTQASLVVALLTTESWCKCYIGQPSAANKGQHLWSLPIYGNLKCRTIKQHFYQGNLAFFHSIKVVENIILITFFFFNYVIK